MQQFFQQPIMQIEREVVSITLKLPISNRPGKGMLLPLPGHQRRALTPALLLNVGRSDCIQNRYGLLERKFRMDEHVRSIDFFGRLLRR